MIDRLIDISNGTLFGLCVICAFHFLTSTIDDAPRRLRRWTGILLLVIGIMTLLCIVGLFLFPSKLDDVGASVTVGLLAAPFAVFVMMELTRLCEVTWRRAVAHLCIPVLLAAVYLCLLFSDLPLSASAQAQARNATLLLYCIWMGGYGAYYIYRFTVASHHYEQVVGDIYADVEGRSINWLRRVLVILGVIVVMFVFMVNRLDERWTWVAYNVMVTLFLMVLCHNINLMRDNEAVEITDEEPQTRTEAAEQDSTVEEQSNLVSDLRTLMLERKLYQQSGLTREAVARVLGTNHKDLTRRIKSETGMTFSQFVTAIRLDRAAELLTSTVMTVDEILYACGFRSNSTFYRQFTERYHCTPIEYRQNNSK